MTTAFVFSGGGSLGAVEVGMMLALAEAGIAPDLVVGTSVGAINAAWVADHPDVAGAEQLASIWYGIRRSDVFPTRLLTGLLGFLGRRDSLLTAAGLRRLIEANMSTDRIEATRVPLHVVAADITTGLEVVMTSGPTVDVLTASAAIPGVFPPVEIGGRTLVDGGVLNNTPVSCAVGAGATEVYVLPTGYACALSQPPRAALDVAIHAVTLMIHQRLAADVDEYQQQVDLHVVPPLCPLEVSPVDFGQTRELVARARASTQRWLASDARSGAGQSSVLRLHSHR
ncbi:MAG: patatin-like phospholipase family protein [Actinobacteria bacterium]|nr:patatin-like phospholipase family protein [Actinomycetota bacterium]